MDPQDDFEEDYEYTESDYVPNLNTQYITSNDPQQDGEHRRFRTSSRAGKKSFRSSKNISDVLNSTDLNFTASVETFDDDDFECEDGHYVDMEEILVELENTLHMSFLDKFVDLPNIGELSSESEETIIEKVEEKTVDLTLAGKFVDPLTGLDIIESDREEEYDFVEIEEFYEEEDESCELDITEDSELLQLQEHEIPIEAAEVDNTLFDMDYLQKIMQAVDFQDFEQFLAEDTHRQCEEIVAAFIEDLFKLVDTAIQYKDPQEILRKSMDKRRVMDEINEKVQTLETEQAVRFYLNRNITEYYRRKRMYRAITDDSIENLDFLMAKYQSILQKYNEILGREEEIGRVIKIKIDKLRVLLEEKQHIAEEKISEFEALVYRVLLRTLKRDVNEGELDLKLLDNTENVERTKVS